MRFGRPGNARPRDAALPIFTQVYHHTHAEENRNCRCIGRRYGLPAGLGLGMVHSRPF